METTATVFRKEVIEIVSAAENINPKGFKRKALFNTCVIITGFIILAVDFWLISQGSVETIPGKRLAAFIGILACALSVVGFLSLVALLLSGFAYQRLNLLSEQSDKLDVEERYYGLAHAVIVACRSLKKDDRALFVDTLIQSKFVSEDPGLKDELKSQLTVQ